MKEFSFIDIFAGAGGLAEGFILNSFKPVAHIEMNKFACDTLLTRAAYHYLCEHNKISIYNNYLSGKITRDKMLSYIPNDIKKTILNITLSENNLTSTFKTIRENLPNNKNVDVLVGGPPCQAYSLVGRAVKGKKIIDDPRNFLYKIYLKFLNEFKPKVFIFENVVGLLSANNGSYLNSLKYGISKAGYNLDLKILVASDFGVLQNRKRIIIIGIRKDLKKENLFPDSTKFSKKYTLSEIFLDLPPLLDDKKVQEYCNDITPYCKKTNLRTKTDVLTQHYRRYINEHDKMIYRLAISKWNREKKRLLYTDIPLNQRTHKNQKSFLDRFKVVASNEHESQTILAHLSKDGHYFIHPDINQCRSITIREAARIQSFPDSYYFEGNRGAAFTQIGNAVPPLMSKAIASKIYLYLEGLKNE